MNGHTPPRPPAQPPDVIGALSAGWMLFIEHALVSIVGILIIWVANWTLALPGDVLDWMAKDAGSEAVTGIVTMVKAPLAIIAAAVQIFLFTGYVRITIDAVRSTPEVGLVAAPQAPRPRLALLFSQGRRVLGTTAVMFLLVLAIGAGLVLLVVPGVVIALSATFTLHLMVDRGLGPIAALKESWRITRGHWLRLLGFYGIALCVFVAGLLACGVGLVVAVPVVYLALAALYVELANAAPPR